VRTVDFRTGAGALNLAIREDPLIQSEAVAVPIRAEIRILDGLLSFAGYPLGTSPVSKVT